MGAKKRPFYRLVVADARSPRDGRFIEAIGTYDPLADPAVVKIDAERVKEWMSKGARPTDIARQLLVAEGILEGQKRTFPAVEKKPKLNKKALAREAAAAATPPPAAAEPVVEAAPEVVTETEPAPEPVAEAEPEPAAGAASEPVAEAEAPVEPPAETEETS